MPGTPKRKRLDRPPTPAPRWATEFPYTLILHEVLLGGNFNQRWHLHANNVRVGYTEECDVQLPPGSEILQGEQVNNGYFDLKLNKERKTWTVIIPITPHCDPEINEYNDYPCKPESHRFEVYPGITTFRFCMSTGAPADCTGGALDVYFNFTIEIEKDTDIASGMRDPTFTHPPPDESWYNTLNMLSPQDTLRRWLPQYPGWARYAHERKSAESLGVTSNYWDDMRLLHIIDPESVQHLVVPRRPVGNPQLEMQLYRRLLSIPRARMISYDPSSLALHPTRLFVSTQLVLEWPTDQVEDRDIGIHLTRIQFPLEVRELRHTWYSGDRFNGIGPYQPLSEAPKPLLEKELSYMLAGTPTVSILELDLPVEGKAWVKHPGAVQRHLEVLSHVQECTLVFYPNDQAHFPDIFYLRRARTLQLQSKEPNCTKFLEWLMTSSYSSQTVERLHITTAAYRRALFLCPLTWQKIAHTFPEVRFLKLDVHNHLVPSAERSIIVNAMRRAWPRNLMLYMMDRSSRRTSSPT